MRVLVPLLVLLGLTAACGGGSNAGRTPTTSITSAATPAATPHAVLPFTPVEEVLTPPPDIDTSGWLTYRDDEGGFELKYPPETQVSRNVGPSTMGTTGTGTEIDLPFERGTTLEAKYIFIKLGDVPADACAPPLGYTKPDGTPAAQRIHNDTAMFWRTGGPGGTMMHGFWTTTYMTSKGNSCVTIDAVLYGISSGAPLDTPPKPSDDQKESETFSAIISTFRWLDQP